MQNLIKITKRYYDDHVDCDCEAPAIIKRTKQHYYIDATDKAGLAELIERATFYSEEGDAGGFSAGYEGLVKSAKATLRAIEKSGAQ